MPLFITCMPLCPLLSHAPWLMSGHAWHLYSGFGQTVNQRKEENIKQLEFSFKPYIGQRSRKLARNVTEKDVIKRLYSLSNERASSSTRSPKFGSKRNKSYTFINATPDETQKSLEITFSE